MADIWSTGMLRTDSSPYYQALEVQTKNAEVPAGSNMPDDLLKTWLLNHMPEELKEWTTRMTTELDPATNNPRTLSQVMQNLKEVCELPHYSWNKKQTSPNTLAMDTMQICSGAHKQHGVKTTGGLMVTMIHHGKVAPRVPLLIRQWCHGMRTGKIHHK